MSLHTIARAVRFRILDGRCATSGARGASRCLAAAFARRTAACAAFLSATDLDISAIRPSRMVSGFPVQYSAHI